MTEWWKWLVGGLVVLLAVAAWARWRATRSGGPGPRRDEIWWAEVPFADGTGAKLRPCLVTRTTWRGAVVLKITSQDKHTRRDHIPIPTKAWDPRARRDSYLNLAEPITVRRAAFKRRAGTADSTTLSRIAQATRGRTASRTSPNPDRRGSPPERSPAQPPSATIRRTRRRSR
jgi:hypothetical protein